MKKGGKSNIEKKLEGIHYPFSEDSWDKMEMLLNEEDNKLTGGLPAPQEGNTVQGIFRSIGLVAVLVVATLGATSSTEINSSSFTKESETPTEKQINTTKQGILEVDTKTEIIIADEPIYTSLVSRRKIDQAVVPTIPYRKHFIMQNRSILLKRPIQLNPLPSGTSALITKPNLAQITRKQSSTNWHFDLQFGYERLPQSLLLFSDFKNRFHTGLNMRKDLNKNIAINFNYTFSIYNNRIDNEFSLLAQEDESEISINIDTTSNNINTPFDNDILRSSYSNFSKRSAFSNSVGVSTIFKVKKWNFETGLFYEHIIPQQGIRGNNWGINTSINRQISDRINLNLTGRYGSSTPSIDSKIFNNYSLGLGLKYKLK